MILLAIIIATIILLVTLAAIWLVIRLGWLAWRGM
jgi:hypothetical protein